jgi:hypothetical protein
MKFCSSFLIAPLAGFSLWLAAVLPAHADHHEPVVEVPAVVKDMAERLARCGVASPAQFPEEAAVPPPPEWTGTMELPVNDVRGVDVFTHTLIVHQVSNSAYVISTGGTEGGKVRGPIPLDWQCKKKAAKPAKRPARTDK